MYYNVSLGQLKDQKIFPLLHLFIASDVGFMRAYSQHHISPHSGLEPAPVISFYHVLSRLKAAMTICWPGGGPDLGPRLVRAHHRPPHLTVLRRGQNAAAAAARSARYNEPLSSQCVGPQ